MNTFVPLLLQESMAQHSTGKHEQWRGNMTDIANSYGIITSIGILTAVIHLMIKLFVDKPRNCFRQEAKLMVAIG
jgi:hypothetical protein